MDNVKEIILQTKNVEYLKNSLGNEIWVQVSGHREMNGADAGFWCGLVSLDHIDDIYHKVGWDVSAMIQGCPGFEGVGNKYKYKVNLLSDGFESILYYREFYGVEEDYIELSQEFILLNNLRYDYKSKSYWAMYDNGEKEEAVKYIDATTILIKMKFLRSYSAAKQMAILLFFDIRTKRDGQLSDYGVDEFNFSYKKDGLFYGLWDGNMKNPSYAYSVLMGKKVIMPAPIEECGYWPYIRGKTYEEFIIGVDESGKEIIYSCDPNKLNDYFGTNPNAPMYLRPVFFKREVLQKYVSKPELYEIGDGYLRCKSLWSIRIDNHHKNCIAVYLGDLGRDLPESEQGYWKSYNIVGEEGLSEVSFQRDFCNMFTQSDMEDHKFLNTYSSLNNHWYEKYGWYLFLPLTEEDQYNLSQIRIPIGNSQPEFDQLVLELVKVLIDSLNEKELIVPVDNKAGIKGISKLEKWLQLEGVTGYEDHINFLRNLQKLRSTGSGHRKGKGYNDISNSFGLSEKSKIDVFEEILKNANAFLKYMEATFLN